jgi:hypothetical protein
MIRYLLILMLVLPYENFDQDVNAMLREAQQLESAFKENESFAKYSEILKLQPKNLTALCKCSELCSRIGNRQKEKGKKIDYFRAAKTYASAALRVNSNNSEANFVMAFALGRQTLISSGKERIAAVKDIRYYADLSIREDPDNFKPYHVLGKWNYEVSNLSLTERSLAKWIFGGLPKASLRDAIVDFERSLSLQPSFLLNYLELGRAYSRNNERRRAIEILEKMLTLPNMMLDDTRIKEEGRQMLSELK